jgi:hypothetical protein
MHSSSQVRGKIVRAIAQTGPPNLGSFRDMLGIMRTKKQYAFIGRLTRRRSTWDTGGNGIEISEAGTCGSTSFD